jgi:hypothetical protein
MAKNGAGKAISALPKNSETKKCFMGEHQFKPLGDSVQSITEGRQ